MDLGGQGSRLGRSDRRSTLRTEKTTKGTGDQEWVVGRKGSEDREVFCNKTGGIWSKFGEGSDG